jgi:hypothetical protein
MFEFRWKKLKLEEEIPEEALPIPGNMFTEYRVLQVRQQDAYIDDFHPEEPVIRYSEWGEWENIKVSHG